MNEIDNHADTICAGPNWKLLELSSEYCTVPPLFPQITNRNKTSRLRSAPLRTHALVPVATLSSSSLIKCYGLVMDYTAP
jgi:hypothetical protein